MLLSKTIIFLKGQLNSWPIFFTLSVWIFQQPVTEHLKKEGVVLLCTAPSPVYECSVFKTLINYGPNITNPKVRATPRKCYLNRQKQVSRSILQTVVFLFLVTAIILTHINQNQLIEIQNCLYCFIPSFQTDFSSN